MATPTKDFSESVEVVGKAAKRRAVAIWVYALAVLLLAIFFDLSLQETGEHLTIVTIFYFLGSSLLMVLLVRLVMGRMLNLSVHFVTNQAKRTSQEGSRDSHSRT